MKSFLILLSSLALLSSTSSMAAASPETKPSHAVQTPFRFAAVTDKSLGVWEGNQPVFVYNHGLISPTTQPSAAGRSSYLHPLYGLDGEILTDDFPKDHDYHRGLYWAWPHIKIGTNEYDLWSLRGIRS